MMPEPKPPPLHIPFPPSKSLIFALPPEYHGKVDVYIDGTVAIGPDLPGIIPRLAACILLSFHLVFRPLSRFESIPRNEAAAVAKLISEGGLEETKQILGWLYDTRRLLISLPDSKTFTWIDSITDLIARGETTASELETIIGRLNHIGYILPTARHFLSRLRKLQSAARFKRQIHIPKQVLKDLELWKTFLYTSNKGISMNLLTYRQTTHVYCSDACEHGLGGLSALGWAWRWLIPVHLRSRAHINLLEFLWNIVCIWVDIIDKAIPP